MGGRAATPCAGGPGGSPPRTSIVSGEGLGGGMSRRKTERLLGLVVCLLSTRRYLTADQIRSAVPGYPEQDDLFKRMFERDKEDLRELGVPLETGVNHPFDDDPGYRIRRQAYELPELRLKADEAAVLGLAARVWSR